MNKQFNYQIVFVVLILLITKISNAQQGVIFSDQPTPQTAHTKAILELKSTDKGLLIPRVSSLSNVGTTLDATANGMLVFLEDADPAVSGFYYYVHDPVTPVWKKLANTDFQDTDWEIAATMFIKLQVM